MSPLKERKIKKAEFSEPIYLSEYEVYFGPLKRITDWYQDTYNLQLVIGGRTQDKLEPAAFTFFDSNRGKYVMVFGFNPSADIIAHECLHAAKLALGHIGYEAEPENDEPEAYFLSFLVRMVNASKKQKIAKPAPKKRKKK